MLLGTGEFGKVYRAKAVGLIEEKSRTTVAVKTTKSTSDEQQIKALRSEVKIMIHIGRHINIVNILGACSKNIAKKGKINNNSVYLAVKKYNNHTRELILFLF